MNKALFASVRIPFTQLLNKPMKTPFLTHRAAAALAALLIAASPVAGTAPVPKVGEKAPPVTGKNQHGKSWKLADVVGKTIVLPYFHPKDDTPGCTK